MAAPLAILALALGLTSCGADDGPVTAGDPSGEAASPEASQPPDVVPAAPGAVSSAGLATVIDTGDGAELCLGAVASSNPPQCGGPAIPNWDWSEQRGFTERQSGVRWGTFAVTGSWDGTSFAATGAIPGALYDAVLPAPVELPEPSVELDVQELQAVSTEMGEVLPGYLGSSVDEAGRVMVDVVYDDGTLQAYADKAYGAGVVVLVSALSDVEQGSRGDDQPTTGPVPSAGSRVRLTELMQ